MKNEMRSDAEIMSVLRALEEARTGAVHQGELTMSANGYKWIFVDKHDTLDIELAREEDLVKATLSPELRVQYHLVSTELWVEYTDTRNRLQNLRKKLSEGPPPKLTVVADMGVPSGELRSAPVGAGVVASRPTR